LSHQREKHKKHTTKSKEDETMKMMKKMIAVLLIAMMVLTSIAALADGKIKTTGNVNVRKGAGLDYSSKGTVSKGTTLNFDKTAKDARGVIWYHITNGKTGWVSSKYTVQVENKASSGKSEKKSGETIKATGNVHVRKGAGLDYAVATTMKKGAKAEYLGKTAKDARGVKWYKVSYKGKTGWVSSKYAKFA